MVLVMFQAFQILTVLLVAVALASTLAHVMELPGKFRLSKESYLTVQSIYYPGFTIAGGIGEFGGIVATFVLAMLTPAGTAQFWLTLGALLALLAMHAVYWALTHPVNNFWLKDVELQGFSAGFFSLGLPKHGSLGLPKHGSLGLPKHGSDAQALDWTALRDRWEYSHVLRAGLALLGFILLVTAIVL
jgi:hypothetical protein